MSQLESSSDRWVALDVGDARLDLGDGVVVRAGRPPTHLTTRERALAAYLAARAGQDVSRDELLVAVFGYAPTVVSRALDTTVARLRAKLEVDPAAPALIQTVHGFGYRWGAPRITPPPSPTTGADRVRIGAARIDLARGRVHRDGAVVALTSAERFALARLCAADGRPVAAEDLTTSTRTRRVAAERVARVVSRLRRKLGAGAIRTIAGAGYAVDVVRDAPAATPAELTQAVARRVAPRLGCDRWIVYALDDGELVELAADGGDRSRAGAVLAVVVTTG